MQPLRVVVFGTSFGGAVQLEGFRRHPGFEVVGVAGTDAARTRALAEAKGVAHASTDWRALLEAAAPDVVSVVTPPDLHHPMAMAALARGCHVLCEKPTALNRHQAAEMRDAARAAGRVLGINHEFRFFPARRRMLELVAEGAIGAPRRGDILGRYALWVRPELRAMGWLSERARGGGILGALGSHHTDCLRTVFGEPRSVLASVRTTQPRRGPTPTDPREGIATADDGFTLHLAFGGGETAIVDCDAAAPYRWERFEIHGEDATLRWDETGYRLWRIAPRSEPEELVIPERLALEPQDGDPALVAPFRVLVDTLYRAIRDGAPLAPNFDDAVAVQSVLDAARASADGGVRVAIEVPAPAIADAVHAG